MPQGNDKCHFDAAKCTQQCPKYSMCSYQAIQLQIIEIQNQMNLLLATILNMSIIQQPTTVKHRTRKLKENSETDPNQIGGSDDQQS